MEDLENSDRTPKRRALDLSFVQVAASALATVVGAVLASELGIYGTIIGAAVVSVGATIGSAVFQHVFRRTGEQIRNLAPTTAHPVPNPALVRSPEDSAAETRLFDPFDPGGEKTRMMAAISPPDDAESVTTYRGRTTWKPKGWKTYAVMAALVFALAMSTVTVVELVAGKPLTDIVKNESGTGTSLGGSSGGSGGSVTTGGTPSVTPSATTSEGGAGQESSSTPSSTPSGTPSSTPSSTPSTSESASSTPSGSASSTPSGGASDDGGAAAETPSTTPTG